MDSKKYVESALETETKDYFKVVQRFSQPDQRIARLNHAALGLASESVELREAIQKNDRVNIMEECGDHAWYAAIAIDALGLSPEMINSDDDSYESTFKKIFKDYVDTVYLNGFLIGMLAISIVEKYFPALPMSEFLLLSCIVTVPLIAYIKHSAAKDATSQRLALAETIVSNASSELCDLVKKEIQYGKTVEVEKYQDVLKELIRGLSLTCKVAGYSLYHAKDRNIEKLLKKRYAGGYTDAKAIHRDVEAERKTLEGKPDVPKK